MKFILLEHEPTSHPPIQYMYTHTPTHTCPLPFWAILILSFILLARKWMDRTQCQSICRTARAVRIVPGWLTVHVYKDVPCASCLFSSWPTSFNCHTTNKGKYKLQKWMFNNNYNNKTVTMMMMMMKTVAKEETLSSSTVSKNSNSNDSSSCGGWYMLGGVYQRKRMFIPLFVKYIYYSIGLPDSWWYLFLQM